VPENVTETSGLKAATSKLEIAEATHLVDAIVATSFSNIRWLATNIIGKHYFFTHQVREDCHQSTSVAFQGAWDSHQTFLLGYKLQ